jgi:hypothetical protein
VPTSQRVARRRGRPLSHRDRKAGEIGVGHQAELTAGEFQHRALLVAQHDGAGAAADGKASAGCSVNAGDIGRTIDAADAAVQHGLRSSEHQAVIQSADRKRISPSVEGERAAAAGRADDPAAFINRQRHRAAVGASDGTQAKADGQREQNDAKPR